MEYIICMSVCFSNAVDYSICVSVSEMLRITISASLFLYGNKLEYLRVRFSKAVDYSIGVVCLQLSKLQPACVCISVANQSLSFLLQYVPVSHKGPHSVTLSVRSEPDHLSLSDRLFQTYSVCKCLTALHVRDQCRK